MRPVPLFPPMYVRIQAAHVKVRVRDDDTISTEESQ